MATGLVCGTSVNGLTFLNSMTRKASGLCALKKYHTEFHFLLLEDFFNVFCQYVSTFHLGTFKSCVLGGAGRGGDGWGWGGGVMKETLHIMRWDNERGRDECLAEYLSFYVIQKLYSTRNQPGERSPGVGTKTSASRGELLIYCIIKRTFLWVSSAWLKV